MGLFDAISDFFSGGSSNTSSSGYEQEAYGGSKRDYYNAASGGSQNDSQSSQMGQAAYNQSQAAINAAKARAEQERRRETERQLGIINQGINYFDPLTSGGNIPLELDPQQYYGMFKAPQAGVPVSPVIEEYANIGGDLSGDDFSDFVNLRLGNDIENIEVINEDVYAKDNLSAAGFFGKLGQSLGNFVMSTLGGLFTGDVIFGQTGSIPGAVTGANTARSALSGMRPIKIDTYVDAQGNQYVKSDIFGKEDFKTVEEVEANAQAARERAEIWQSESDSTDVANALRQGLNIATSAGNPDSISLTSNPVSGASPDAPRRKASWRDYYDTGLDVRSLAGQAITGSISGSDLKSLEFGTKIAMGEDVVKAAFDTFGESVRDILPAGYEQPTEAAVRIGLGENRVAVLGDIYGADFNLDSPLGKAGLKGAEVFDMTGNADKALQDSVYTYFKEGGKLPDFEVPDFLPEVDLNFDFDKFKGMGMSIRNMFDFGVDVAGFGLDWPTLSGEGLSFGELPELGFDVKKIDFGGTKLTDIDGLNLGNLDDFGLSIEDLPEMNIDFDLDLLGLTLAEQESRKGMLLGDDEEEASLEEDEDLFDPTRSLAREMLGMEQRREVKEAQERA